MSTIKPTHHSSEHILTAIIGNLFGGEIVDSRFRGKNVRCDYKIQTVLELDEIIKKIQEESNKIISEKRDVTFENVSPEEAKNKCSLHRVPDGIENVRLVKIGANIVTPCIGDHVKNTSEINRIEIRNYRYIEPNVIRLTIMVY